MRERHGHPTISAIFLRVAIALLSMTFFQPDEYFQALEPAHEIVFGYGHLTWEWRSKQPIRSVLFPMVFVPVYWTLKFLRLDDSQLLILVPKFVQGLLASVTDMATGRLCRNVFGQRYASTAFFLSMTSIFHAQALSRTLSNSLETSLTAFALADWPLSSLPSSQIRVVKPLIFAAIACMVRPINIIIWAFLFLELSWRLRYQSARLAQIWLQACVICMTACLLLFLLDSWYYDGSTFTPLNFFKTNLRVSTFYGSNPWHYYISQGIPVLCNVSIFLVIQGLWKSIRSGTPPARRLVALIFWTIGIYSLAAHKEWRFIHPLLPVMHVFASKILVDDCTAMSSTTLQRRWWFRSKWHKIFILAFALVTPYVLFVQSRAQISVMHHVRSIPGAQLRSVGFLMPCHSTPWQSYLHRPYLTTRSLWALGCEPPLGGQNLHTYRDQSDIFYASPAKYLRTRFPTTVDPSFPPSPYPVTVPGTRETIGTPWEHAWPSHLVMFGSLLESDGVRDLFESLGYQQEWYGWNGWEQDHRRRGGVRVWSWKPHNIVLQ